MVLGSGTITTTTAPLVFVEYNYIVPRLHNTTTLYRDYTIQLHCTDTLQLQILGSGTMMATTPPRVCRIQLHCTDILQLQVLGSGTITATTAPLVFVEYNYIVPTLYSCRFLGVVRSRPRWPPRVCRIQLHCTDTLQLQVVGSGTITDTTAPSCL